MIDGVQWERDLYATVTVVIPEDRIADMGRKNADITQQIQDIEEEAARVAKSFKARIGALETDVRDRSRTIRIGTEIIEVECSEFFDRTFGRAYQRRNDTGEIINNRPLAEHELQLYLKLGTDEDGDEDEGEPGEPATIGEAENDEESLAVDGPQLAEEEPQKPLTPAQARREAKKLAQAAREASGEEPDGDA